MIMKPQENKTRLQYRVFLSNRNHIAVPEPAGIPLLVVHISPYLPERRALSVKSFA